MKIGILIATLLLSTFPTLLCAAPLEKPNIVVIVADDLGWNTVSYHDGFTRTPNIDRIAKEGVDLNRFYVSPMCSPTRAGIMTGRYALHLGMGRSVVRPWAKYGLPTDALTIPEALAPAGYTERAAFGKWHLGHLDPKWHPLSVGFTRFIGCYNGAADYWTRDRDGEIDWHSDWSDIQPKGYTTDLIADAATDFISAQAKSTSPYFCYIAFTSVHEPLQAPDKYIAQYPNLKIEDKRKLAAMNACMDDDIGRILKAIDDSGKKSNTLIWFLSDNGGIRSIPANNAPLRAGKLTVYEGGVRTPAAVWWPGVIEGGRKIQTPIANIDLLPTFVRVASSSAKSHSPLDGIDVFDLLTGKSTTPPDRDIYSFTGQTGLDDEQIAINSADGWKLVVIGPDVRREGGITTPKHKIELFHLSKDFSESKDLSKENPDKVAELAKKLIAFRKSEPQGALEPSNRKPADFVTPPHWHNAPKQ